MQFFPPIYEFRGNLESKISLKLKKIPKIFCKFKKKRFLFNAKDLVTRVYTTFPKWFFTLLFSAAVLLIVWLMTVNKINIWSYKQILGSVFYREIIYSQSFLCGKKIILILLQHDAFTWTWLVCLHFQINGRGIKSAYWKVFFVVVVAF